MKKIRLFILFYLFSIILRDFYQLYDNGFGLCLCSYDLAYIPILLAPTYLIYFIYRLKGTFSLDLFSKVFIIYYIISPILDSYFRFGNLEYFMNWSELIFSLPLVIYLFVPNKLQRLTFLTFGFQFLFNLLAIPITIQEMFTAEYSETFNISVPVAIISVILRISFLAISFEFLSYLSKKLTRSPFVKLGDLFLVIIISPLFYFIYMWLNLKGQISNLFTSYEGQSIALSILFHTLCLILFVTFGFKRLSLQFKSFPTEIVVDGTKLIKGGKNLVFYSYSILISVLVSIVLIIISLNTKNIDLLQTIGTLSSVLQVFLSIAIICFLSLATYNFLTSDKLGHNLQKLLDINDLGRISNLLKQLFWASIVLLILSILTCLILVPGLFYGELYFYVSGFSSSPMIITSVLLSILSIFFVFKFYQLGKVCRENEKNAD